MAGQRISAPTNREPTNALRQPGARLSSSGLVDRILVQYGGELIRFVQAKPGPRIVLLNTVQAAAMITHEMREAGRSILRLFSCPTVPYQPVKLGICDPHCRACTTCPYTSAGTDGPLRVQC